MHKRFRLAILAGVFAIGMGSGVALAVQVHMRNALADLNAASAQLNAALPDKAGHRAAAINLVSQAIAQVQAGLAAGR